MNFQQRINRAISKKTKSPEKAFFEYLFVFAKEFGWSYEEFCNTPLPVIMGLASELEEFNKKQEKLAKKKR